MAKMTVKELQQALIALGYDLGPTGADGDPGPYTAKATQSFQKSIGLIGGGIPGPRTFRGLQDAVLKRAVRQVETPRVTTRKPDSEPEWLRVARADLGLLEGPGKLNEPKVVSMFAESGFPGIKEDSVAWCAAAVGAWLARAGLTPSGSLAARSYEHWGVGLQLPALGCVATKRRGNSPWQGHVGLVVGASRTKIFLLGGNQGDKVSIAGFNRAEFTSFRWPSGQPLPTSFDLPTTIAGAKSNVSQA